MCMIADYRNSWNFLGFNGLVIVAVFLIAGNTAQSQVIKDLKADSKTGEQIYKQQCLSCHGAAGEGSKKFKKSLTGDLSVGQLTKLIDETMPEDDPDKCVGEDARRVAEYIHESFYSITAQARNKPPRVELVRLTNRQYQNSVMDLVGSFRAQGQKSEPKGLNAEYFSTRQMNRSNRVIERVDPVVMFNFGSLRPHDPPAPAKVDPPKDDPKKPELSKAKPATEPKKPEPGTPEKAQKPSEAKKNDQKSQTFGPIELALADAPKPADKPKLEPKKPEVSKDKPKDEPKKPENDPEELKKKIEEQKRKQREAERKQRELQKKKDEEAKQFAARWQGSVLASESGDFEFVVRTENAFRLWVNDNEKPLMDAWVKSGNDKEFRQTIKLNGGRSYLIRLEMFKFREPTASIELAWKRPGAMVVETISAGHLSPTWNPKRFIVCSPFPPDDRSFGYERGISISKAWESATTDAAIETASHVLENLNELAGTKADAADRNDKIRQFAAKFTERAFRRPLTDSQRKLHVENQFEKTKEIDLAIRRVILLALKSPRFLYQESHGKVPDGFDVASRLSFALWDSIPDQALMEAASKNQLEKPEQVAAQADRMSRDPRSRQKMREFLMSWLRLEGTPDLSKDPKSFPEFTPDVIADLRNSLEMSLDDFLTADKPDHRALLTGSEWYANDKIAKIYGLKMPSGAGFRKVRKTDSEPKSIRSGLITHPYILAHLSYTMTTSPIHRGVFLSRNVLGRGIKPPPIAVSPLAPDLHPDLTTRQRVALQTSPAACVSCHNTINPLGFALEHFDAIGRYRDQEKGKPIDSTGDYLNKTGSTVRFDGAEQLGEYLATAEETQMSIVMQLFHHTVKQPILAYGLEVPEELRTGYVAGGYDVRKLMARSAALAALGAKKPVETNKPSVVAGLSENDRR